MKDLSDIKGKSQVVSFFYKKYTPLVNATVFQFYGSSDHDDKVQDFWKDRICCKSEKELREIDQKGFSYMKMIITNYLIDRKRQDKSRKKKHEALTQFLITREESHIPVYIDTKATIDRCKSIIKRKFPDAENSLKIFDLMLDSAGMDEMKKETGLKPGNIRVIIHRIRKALKNKI